MADKGNKHDHDKEEEDLDEETLHNVVSGKGRLASFLHVRSRNYKILNV